MNIKSIDHNVVAYCPRAAGFLGNKIFRPEIAERYPGAMWILHLIGLLANNGIDAMTGDVAVKHVANGTLNPANIMVVQEDLSRDADTLIDLGAKAKVLLCGESPLFAADFYSRLPDLSSRFEHCIVFAGALGIVHPMTQKHVLRFPSFDPSQLTDGALWEKRDHLVMVAANKYWKVRRSFVRSIASRLRDRLYSREKYPSEQFEALQLHDQRLASISFFGRQGRLHLYGHCWNSLANLPPRWEYELSQTISNIEPEPCVDKLATISCYRYSLCFENIAYPGYITEKILHCLVAGVVPIYLGAPDISEHIPKSCFVDFREFSSLDDLSCYLDRLTRQDWVNYLESGKSFLHGLHGTAYSYHAFAERIMQMLVTGR